MRQLCASVEPTRIRRSSQAMQSRTLSVMQKKAGRGKEIPSGRKWRKTKTEDERSDGNDHPASRHITFSPAPSHSCQIPPSQLIPRFLVISSSQRLPVHDNFSLVISVSLTCPLSPIGIASLYRSRSNVVSSPSYDGFPVSFTRHPTAWQIQRRHSFPFPGLPQKGTVGRSS